MHLYAAFLGGELAPNRMGEDHEVVFVVAEDTTSARKAAQTKWGGDGRAHVDAVTRLDDGLEPDFWGLLYGHFSRSVQGRDVLGSRGSPEQSHSSPLHLTVK